MRARLLLVAMVAVSSCAGDSRTGPEAPPEPSPSEATYANGGDCPAARASDLPSDAGCVSTVTAGDAMLRVYALLNAESRPRSWRLNLSVDGSEIDQRLDAGNAYSYPRAVGSSDVDGDGSPDWWVKVVDFTSHGAPWSGLNLYFVLGDRLVPLEFEGQPLGIHYGGISRMGEGARCESGRIVLLRAEAQNVRNTHWKTSHRTFSIDGAKARFEGRTEHLLVIRGYNDPDLDPYYEIDCNGFTFPVTPGAGMTG